MHAMSPGEDKIVLGEEERAELAAEELREQFLRDIENDLFGDPLEKEDDTIDGILADPDLRVRGGSMRDCGAGEGRAAHTCHAMCHVSCHVSPGNTCHVIIMWCECV